jgi:hypothetical protein
VLYCKPRPLAFWLAVELVAGVGFLNEVVTETVRFCHHDRKEVLVQGTKEGVMNKF